MVIVVVGGTKKGQEAGAEEIANVGALFVATLPT